MTDLDRLKEFCLNFDPYEEISPDIIPLLKQYNIEDLSDPFKVTNQLLQILDTPIN